MRDWMTNLGKRRPVAATPSVDLSAALVGLLIEGTPADALRLREVGALLALSPTGTSDVLLMAANDIAIRFDTRKGGACYQPSRRTIIINRTQVAARTATDFIHEAMHARLHLQAEAADIDAPTKDAYAQGMIDDETETYYREVVVGRELLHAMRARGMNAWIQTLTSHPMQMYLQLVHGVAYHKPPIAMLPKPTMAEPTRPIRE